ncbi:hypothetical protein CPC16_005527, partial [Podila verticillata]
MFDRLKFKRKTDAKDKDKDKDANNTPTLSTTSANDDTSRTSISYDDSLDSSSLVHRSSTGSNASDGTLHLNNNNTN